MIRAATGGFDIGSNLSSGPVHDVAFVLVGLVVFILFLFLARLVAHLTAQQLRTHQVRADMVVLGRRVVTAGVILLGLFAAIGFAVQSANVTLFGLLLATIVAALGVQDLLKDYVSGYYLLFEHHIRVGDHIDFDGHSGTVIEVRLRVTMLRGEDDELIVVPNSELFTKAVRVRRPAPPK